MKSVKEEYADNPGYRFVVSTIGDPYSASTYSGVPFQLFKAMDKSSLITKRVNGYEVNKLDYISGFFDIKKSIARKRPYRNALWRYRQSTIAKLSRRLDVQLSELNYDVFLQIGCGGLPSNDCFKVAHIEIPISMAMTDNSYAQSYGFYDLPQKTVDDAISGELTFIENCDLIWTNTQWTADGLRKLGVPEEKLLIFPPCINASESRSYVEPRLSEPRLLFIGKDWERKGGPELVSAFELLQIKYPDATLDIIGCKPEIRNQSVRVHGFIDKGTPSGEQRLKEITRNSNIFCMPSQWESTGIVYFEAMENSLPVIMVKGQGREKLFEGISTILEDSNPQTIADAVDHLLSNQETTTRMTKKAFDAVKNTYNYDNFIDVLLHRIKTIRNS